MSEILVCIDGSGFSDSICSHAAWINSRVKTAVKLLHVIPHTPERESQSDLSGTIGINANKELLEKLSAHDEALGKLEMQKGRLLLQHAKEQLQKLGVEQEIGTLKRRGSLAETICEWGGDIEIIIIGKRGELAEFDVGHIGSNLERVARAVHHPLLVAPKVFRPIKKFLIAYDGGVSSKKALEYIISNPLLKGLECHIVTVGRKHEQSRQSLDLAVATLKQSGFDVHSHTEMGHADEVIGSYVKSQDIDLLIIGAYGHSRIRTLIIGSTTTSMIMSCPIPLLLFR